MSLGSLEPVVNPARSLVEHGLPLGDAGWSASSAFAAAFKFSEDDALGSGPVGACCRPPVGVTPRPDEHETTLSHWSPRTTTASPCPDGALHAHSSRHASQWRRAVGEWSVFVKVSMLVDAPPMRC
jgi:hypothetical protein